MAPQHWMDKDEERVPHGMTLGGYDADSQQYSYFDQDGSAWASEPAKRFSTLTRVKTTYTDQLTNEDMFVTSPPPTRRMTFTAPATASEKAEHERLLSMAKQQGSPVGSKKGRSAATSPTDARSPEGETEAEKRKRMKRAVRRMSNAVRKRLSMSKKEEEETGIDYLSYEEFTRPLSGPEVWDSPEWRAERKASEG